MLITLLGAASLIALAIRTEWCPEAQEGYGAGPAPRQVDLAAVDLAREWISCRRVAAVYADDRSDTIIVETLDGFALPRLPMSHLGFPVHVIRGSPYQAEAYGVVSPYSQIVEEVRRELDRVLGPNRYDVRQIFDRNLGLSETVFDAPAPAIPAVRAAVASAMHRHAGDPHARIEERPAPPGVVGGWSMAIIEASGSSPLHIH